MGTLSEVDLLLPPPTDVGTGVGLGEPSTVLTPRNCNELRSMVAEASEGTPSALALAAKVVEKVPLCIAVDSDSPIALFRDVAADASPDVVILQRKTTLFESSREVRSNLRPEDTVTVTSDDETPTVVATASPTACVPAVPISLDVTLLTAKEYDEVLTTTEVGDELGM